MREIKFRAWDGKTMHHFDLSDTIAPSLEIDVMQFTGLKDKNGVEIYEGDKVLCNETIEMIVIYSAPAFILTNENNCLIPFSLYRTIKVIGNIHEKS
jgi:hypothetical protein